MVGRRPISRDRMTEPPPTGNGATPPDDPPAATPPPPPRPRPEPKRERTPESAPRPVSEMAKLPKAMPMPHVTYGQALTFTVLAFLVGSIVTALAAPFGWDAVLRAIAITLLILGIAFIVQRFGRGQRYEDEDEPL